jgi:hypothetical protein
VPLEHTDLYLRKRTTNQHVYFRELSLEPGEEYAFTENVKDYLAIKDPGMYVLEGRFFPELKRRGDLSEPNARTNRLTLEVKPSPAAAAVRVLPVFPFSAEILQPQPRYAPTRWITYLLTAAKVSMGAILPLSRP